MSLNIIAENDLNKEELESEENVNQEQEEEQHSAPVDQEENTEQEPSVELPEKFKDASKEDIYKAYQEIEKLTGRQSQEIGELRKLADDFLRQEIESRNRTTPKEAEDSDTEISFDDLAEDPHKAVKKATEKEINTLREDLNSMKQERALEEFQKRHPDYLDVGQDEEFQQWLQKSPYRIRRFQAAQQYDLDAADELLTEFKDRKEVLKQQQDKAKEKVEEKREENLKKATVESGSNREKGSKKIFRRADLIRMRQERPEEFEARFPEIQAAYAEGRVK